MEGEIMDKIAFIVGETFLYWNSILLTLGAACAVCLFLGFYLSRGGRGTAAAAAVPMAMLLSLVIGRFLHWYCRADAYAGLGAAMTDYSGGGYALLGAFLGCFLTAVLLRLTKVSENLPEMLDAMSVAGAAGIAVGRLSYFYSATDRGFLTVSKSLPIAYPVTNAVSGAVEYRLATFLLQAILTGIIFVLLAVYFFSGKRKTGDIALLFLMLYCAEQTVLDSTRYDSLFLRSNGFISVVQLLSAVAVIAVAVFWAVRAVRNRGFRKWFVPVWIAIPALMGGAGYMEYYVQRHGDLTTFCYSIMGTCLAALTVLSAVLYFAGRKTVEE